MSLSDKTSRRFIRFAVLGLIAVGLGGCFTPLHGTALTSANGGVSVRENLASVKIASVSMAQTGQDRLAHYLQNELAYKLTGGSPDAASVPTRYRLEITVSESVQSVIVNTTTGNAESALLLGTADFKLIPVDSDKPVLAAKATATSSYDRSTQRFATIRAARDSQIRVATALAEQIHTRLSAGFASGRLQR